MHTNIPQTQISPEAIAARQNLQRNPSGAQGSRVDVYGIITERVVSLLDAGTVPWKKPWKTGESAFPKNLVSDRPYSGINAFLLAMAPFSSPYFLTFKQARDLGGHVQKGEKGLPVIYWNKTEADKESESSGESTRESYAFLRYYTVFNVEQTEGIALPPAAPVEGALEFKPIEECEAIRHAFRGGPEVASQAQRAWYSPSLDVVNMPKAESFHSEAEYYATLFHELTHATGHKTRLDREGITEPHAFGDPVYSKEELIAEMGAAFLCAHAGISPVTLENSTAYIAGWLGKLRSDKKLVIQAAAAAQKAADFILGVKQEGA